MVFELPQLPYNYDSLEPYIDTQTMEIHHTKHHNTYVTKLNNAVQGTELENKDILEIISNISNYSNAIRNNGGGHFNHSFFWNIIGPNGGGKPEGELKELIEQQFGSFDNFKEQFENTALSHFGSGWAWLVITNDGSLKLGSTPNQDNPLMDISDLQGHPLLGIDMWEHAYYLKYQNRKDEYVRNFWNIVNRDEIERRYEELQG